MTYHSAVDSTKIKLNYWANYSLVLLFAHSLFLPFRYIFSVVLVNLIKYDIEIIIGNWRTYQPP